MYVRPPSQGRHGMKLPENYSGNAFSQKPQYSDMPPPVRTQGHVNDKTGYKETPFGDIPPNDTDIFDEPQQYPSGSESEPEANAAGRSQSPAPASIFSSLLPRQGLGNNFPFGHGIGSEEILILAVMLMVFLSGNESGESDRELLLLLGLLLFAG